MKPFGRNILIKPIEKKQVLVSDNPSLTDCGEVIAVGDLVKEIKVGDTLAYVFWGILKVEDIDGELFHLILETDEYILGTL